MEGGTGPFVQGVLDAGEVGGGVHGQVAAFGEPMPKEPIGVLVGAALPRRMRVAEVQLGVERELDLFVTGQLDPSVPGDRAAQCCGRSRMVAIIAAATSSAPC